MTYHDLRDEVRDLAKATRLKKRIVRESYRQVPPELQGHRYYTDEYKRAEKMRAEYQQQRLQELGEEAQRLWQKKTYWDNFRHHHIAASLLRGTPYHRIEQPAPGNEPNWERIQAILDEHSNDEKMTIVVRGDLEPGQQAVQAAHAMAQWMLHSRLRDLRLWRGWHNRRIVILEEGGALDLQKTCEAVRFENRAAIRERVWSKGQPVMFNETGGPLAGQDTAFAVLGDFDCLRHLSLLHVGREPEEAASEPERKGLLERVLGRA